MEHSAVLLTCIKLPYGFHTFDLSILSGRLRQVSLYIDYCSEMVVKGRIYMLGFANLKIRCDICEW